MTIEDFKLTNEHIKKLTELGYTKVNDVFKGLEYERYAKEMGNYSRIDVIYYQTLSSLSISTFHPHNCTIINYFGDIHKLYDDYVHTWQILKEDMEKVFGIDVITGRIIEENKKWQVERKNY